MALKLMTPPTLEPITLQEALTHLKADPGEASTNVDALIRAVRGQAEQETGRSLLPQTWKKTLDQFPDAIRLDRPPIVAVSSVKYYDTAGVQQTLDPATYFVDTESEPGWLVPGANFTWPATQCGRINAVEVIYTAGYADAASVPEEIKQWIKIVMRENYDNPAGAYDGRTLIVMPHVDGLLDRYRVTRWV